MINSAATNIQPAGHGGLCVEIYPGALPRVAVTFSLKAFTQRGSAENAAVIAVEIGGEAKREKPLQTATVVRIAENLDLFVAYARAILVNDAGETEKALKLFQNLGKTKRGMPREFYGLIADEYRQRLGSGEPHPVKAIAAAHNVTPSAASRWVKAAREHGFLESRNEVAA